MTIDPELFERQVRRQRRRRLIDGAMLGLVVAAVTAFVTWAVLRGIGVPVDVRSNLLLRIVPLVTAGLFFAIWVIAGAGGQAATAVLHPGGAGHGPIPTSHAESLGRRGQWADSAKAFDALRTSHGETAALLQCEADLHLAHGGDPGRARELLMRLRQAADATRADELYATQRIIDLYFGPLQDEPRALAEMRRLIERFPGTRDAHGAAAELSRRKRQALSE